MATENKIKRSGVAVSPSTLGAGELAYSWEGTTGGKLFIGWGIENGDGEAANISPIGGKYYTDLLSADSGVATASKAVILGNNKKIDEWSVDNITLDGNTISTTLTNTALTLSPNGTATVEVPAGYKDRSGFGTNSLVTKEYVDGTTSDASKITLVDDAADSDEYITGNNLTFAGGTGLTSSVTNDTVTFDLDNTTVTSGNYGSATQIPTFTVDAQGRLTAAGNQAISTTLDISTRDLATGTGGDSSGTVALGVDTLAFLGDSAEGIQVTFNDVSKEVTINATSATASKKGVASFNSSDFDVTSGDVTIKDGGVSNDQLAGSIANGKLAFDSVTIGTTNIALGGSSTTLAGLTQVDIDNIQIKDNSILTTDTNGNLTLSPNGEGTVVLPASYETRTGLGANSVVPKSYVDAIAEGLHVHASVKAATTQNLATESGGTVTYNNANATLTLSTGISTLDGYTLVDGDRILIKDEASQAHNGIYIRTNSTTFTRASDFNTADEIASGDFLFVENGTVNGSNGYVQTETTTTIGTDDIIFEQFSGAGQIDAGSALTKSGNTLNVAVDDSSIEIASDALQVRALGVTNAMLAGSIDLAAKVTGTLPVGNGGTGGTTFTDNGVMFGNGTGALSVTAASADSGSVLQTLTPGGAPVFSNIIDCGEY